MFFVVVLGAQEGRVAVGLGDGPVVVAGGGAGVGEGCDLVVVEAAEGGEERLDVGGVAAGGRFRIPEAGGAGLESGRPAVGPPSGASEETLMHEDFKLSPNKVANFLDRSPEDFRRKDLIKYVEEHGIRMVNFRYVGGDGKLKTLNFVVNDREYLERILACGERVDGSSLFPYIDTSASDLYVVPRYKTAFVNPFCQVPALDLLCSYYDREGQPLDIAPESILRKAHLALQKETGLSLQALGEVEFYLSSELDRIYTITPQRGYHESHPFAKWELVRVEAMKHLSEMGGRIKYGHAEVGNIVSGDWEYVQHEIEMLPVDVEDAADQLVLAKWVIREVAYKNGLEVSFAPKIIVGHAGSGLHVHMRLMRDGRNRMVDERGGLSDEARRMIGGLLELAPSITAFGNVVPTSFLRLVPHQEAPTNICWGDSNRSVLVRVPLGWRGVEHMVRDANPQEDEPFTERTNNQTVELRSADGSANVHQLLAGITVAARHGLEAAQSLEIAKRLYVGAEAGKHPDDLGLPQLPASCFDAADRLLEQRASYERDGVFPAAVIDGIAAQLKSFDDQHLSERMFGDGDALQALVKRHLHCG